MKAFVALALLCPAATASACSGSSCLEDEVSLVQKKTVVKHGEHTANKGDPVDWKAEINAGEDTGSVISAYKANMAKVEEPIVEDAANDLEFGDKVSEERALVSKKFQDQLEAQQVELGNAIEADREKVKKTMEHTDAVEEKADVEVANAKANFEAHAIKKDQAENAAVVGSIAGRDSGARKAYYMKEDNEAAHISQAEDEAIQEEGYAIKEKRKLDKEFVENKVRDDERHAADYVNNNGQWTRAAEEEDRSDVAAAETAVEGPEGIYNQVTTDYADSTADAYTRKATKSQGRILSAGDAAWPKGQWPEEPSM